MSEHSNTGHVEPSKAPDCEVLREMIPAYCLGALDADERQWVEASLAGCPEVMDDLEAYQALGDALLFSAPQVEPPPGLEARLMRAITVPESARMVTEPARKPTEQRQGWLSLWQWLRGHQRGWAVAALAVIVLVVCNGFWLWQVNQMREEREALSAQLLDREAVIQLLTERTTNRVELASIEDSATASVSWTPAAAGNTWVCLLSARNLPRLSPNMVYQLWLLRGESRVSAGLFTVDEAGDGYLVFYVSEPFNTFEAIGITPEPAGGSEGPTSAPVVAGSI